MEFHVVYHDAEYRVAERYDDSDSARRAWAWHDAQGVQAEIIAWSYGPVDYLLKEGPPSPPGQRLHGSWYPDPSTPCPPPTAPRTPPSPDREAPPVDTQGVA